MIKNVEKFTAIVAKKELMIREIFKFTEQMYPRMLASIEENGLKIVGKPTFISYGRDGSLDKSFQHEVCIPIAKCDDYNGSFEIKEYKSFKCVAKRFDGTINQILRNGIPEILDEAEEKNEKLTNEMREVYYEWHKPRSKKNVVELQFGLK
jgi:effector-binding domain-containing protein